MSEDQLARLFPDGKTVHLPPSGQPLARYAEARAEIDARDRALASAPTGAPFYLAAAMMALGLALALGVRRTPAAQDAAAAE